MKELTGLRKKDFEAGAKAEREKIVKYLKSLSSHAFDNLNYLAENILEGKHNK